MVARYVPLFKPGELAVIVADPPPTPVMVTFTVVEPDGIITLAGTVATVVSLLERLTV